MWQAIIWTCSTVGLLCGSVPDMAVIQTAYEREASAGSKLHDKDLKLLQARCRDRVDERFLCEVVFVSNSDPNQRLYFDIVAVTRSNDGWELKSGLCKR